MVDSDVERYQTVFARAPGAVAAPTAGLHFTKPLLVALEQSGVELSSVTLHVGLGTFQPISADDPSDHVMHREWAEVSATAAREINASHNTGDRVIAVGTTVTRVLETVAAEVHSDADNGDPSLCVRPWSGETDLFIRPPYEFRAIDGLLTNFHFPKTTLLLMVQAFGGSDLIARAYRQAIAESYRFYSYGDAMLIY